MFHHWGVCSSFLSSSFFLFAFLINFLFFLAKYVPGMVCCAGGAQHLVLCASSSPESRFQMLWRPRPQHPPGWLFENLSDHSIAAVAVTWQDLQVVGWDETCVCRRTCLCAWYSTWSLLKSFFSLDFVLIRKSINSGWHVLCAQRQLPNAWRQTRKVKCTTSQMAGDSSFWSLRHISGLTGPLATQPPTLFAYLLP